MNKSLFFVFIAFFSGLLLAHFYSDQFSSISFVLVIIFLILALVLRKLKYLGFFFFLLSFFSIGVIRLEAVSQKRTQLAEYWGVNQVWNFWVCRDPEPAWNKQILTLCLTDKQLNQEKVLVNFPLYPRLYYGDLLKIKCRLEKPVIFSDFDYAAYLQVKGIMSVCSWPELLTLEENKVGNKLNYWLFKNKRRALTYINYYLPEPAAGLASSLLLGYKKTLFVSESEFLRQSGLSHLIAISGAHISLLLYLLINFFIYLGLYKKQAITPSYIFLCLYVLMTGLQASALRALIMGGLVLYAWQAGRLERAINLLILAAFMMLMINPLLWRYDLGFQLSFSALSGMILLRPIFSHYSLKYLTRLYSSVLRNFFEAFYLSLSAQLFIWPLIAVQLGTVSLISPLTNVFAFLIFTPLMFSLLMALVLSFLGLGSLLVFWPAYVFLEYILILARRFSALPLSHFELSNFTWQKAGAYYICLFLFIYIIKKRIKQEFKTKKM